MIESKIYESINKLVEHHSTKKLRLTGAETIQLIAMLMRDELSIEKKNKEFQKFQFTPDTSWKKKK